MDKLTIATQVLLKLIETDKTGFDAEGIAAYSFEIADAMQAEAEKRVNKERPDVLKEEWQPGWSQAPEWANYIAVYSDHCNASYFEKEPKIISGYTWGGTDGKSLITPIPVYAGNWKESLRNRPEALREVDWSAAPKNAFQWQMINNEAYWRIEIMGGLDTEPAPSFGFTGSHTVERPHGF